jgi:pyruvate dehydrogenase (quinone)
VLPGTRPYVTGSISLLGTTPSSELMNGCDTLLMVGSNFPYPVVSTVLRVHPKAFQIFS